MSDALRLFHPFVLEAIVNAELAEANLETIAGAWKSTDLKPVSKQREVFQGVAGDGAPATRC